MNEPGLHARIVDAIWTELERQRDTERFGPCVGRAHDLIDGHVDMDAVATAVIDVLPLSIHDSLPNGSRTRR